MKPEQIPMDTKCVFDGYYKYTFHFETEDGTVGFTAGGDPNDIYRAGIEARMTFGEIVKELGIDTVYIYKEPKQE